jgi:hypothetical protein
MKYFAVMSLTLAATLQVPIGVRGAISGYTDQPPPLPGWVHTQVFIDDTAQKHGIVLSGEDVVRSSPTIAEVDGDVSNGREVVFGGQDGLIYVYQADGTLAWSKSALPAPCSSGSDGRLNGAAAVGNLYGDGVPYVIVSYGTITPSNCDGGIVVLKGSDGSVRWRFSLRAWRDSQSYPPEDLYGMVSSPSLADVDGDGDLEIGFGGLDRNIYLLNADGSVRWFYHAADTVWSSPIFVDIDGDQYKEMIIGADITSNAELGTHDGGYLYAFDTRPQLPLRINFCAPYFLFDCVPGFIRWRTVLDQAIYSSPVAADVISSNAGNEIVIGNGCFWPTTSTAKRGNWIKIVRITDGQVIQTLNTPTCIQSSAAVGDLDDDGALEIVATVMGATAVGGDGASKVMAWKPSNPNPMWTMTPRDPNSGSNDAYGGDLQSPVIADVDGNGSLEVLVANFWSVHVLDGLTGAALTCQGPTATCGAQQSLFTWKTVKSSPAVGDVNVDGVLDVVIGSGNILNGASRGQVYAWTNLQLGSRPGLQPAYSAPWPTFRGDARNAGIYGLRTPLSVQSENLIMMMERSQQRARQLRVRCEYGNSWNATELSDANDIVRLTGASGSCNTSMSLELVAPAQLGTYYAQLRVQSNGVPDVTINVSMTVPTSVTTVYVPAALAK